MGEMGSSFLPWGGGGGRRRKPSKQGENVRDDGDGNRGAGPWVLVGR